MARPKKNRIVSCSPDVCYFKPRGIPLLELEEVVLTIDECEAIRLADLMGLSYEQAGLKMGVSRATFGRIVQHARHVLSDALINGKAIRVEGGHFTIRDEQRIFQCQQCHHQWKEVCGTGRPEVCPKCGGIELHRVTDTG